MLPALETAAATATGLERFRLPGFEPVFEDYERVSINCISWLGSDFASFGGEVGKDEELWLSCVKPAETARPNVMYGGFAVVHFAFQTQRARLESPPGSRVLHRYAALAGIPESDVVSVVSVPPVAEASPEPLFFGPRRRGMCHGMLIEPPPVSHVCPDRMLELIAHYKASQDGARHMANNGAT